MSSSLIIYLLSQATLVGMFTYMAYKEGTDLDKENLGMMAIMVAFGPLGLALIFAVVAYMEMEQRLRMKCRLAMQKWEAAARASKNSHTVSRWDWRMSPNMAEPRYNLLRETISVLSDRELYLLANVKDSLYDIEKPLKDALMDEVIHREILK